MCVFTHYYYKKVFIDIISFWREIGKMSFVPLLVGGVFYVFLYNININTVGVLMLYMLFFGAVYIPLFWFISMNKYEKNLFVTPMKNIMSKVGL